MSTTAQILANQKNATLSTGPRTPEGKATSSHNALKFGLTSQQIVLPGENAADFDAMHAGLAAQLEPATDLECMLIDDIAAAEWRFRRVEAAQNMFVATPCRERRQPRPSPARRRGPQISEIRRRLPPRARKRLA